MSQRYRVLYAEDNPQDADLTRGRFSRETPDFDIEVVGTGRDCLDRISSGGWDLVLLDHRLPDMDGLDVLRALVHGGTSLPVVIVTGSGDEELVIKALRLGASNYVAKVGDYLTTLPELLRLVIEEHRQKPRFGLSVAGPRRILYVEHHAMDIDLTLRHFAEAAPHLTLEVARTCNEGLLRLEREARYDAVLIDLRMPEQSGLDFVREAKRRGLPLPPFILISGKGDEDAAIASLSLGAADYVAKRDGYLDQLPYTIDRAIVHDQLNRTNAQLQAELAERKQAESERMRLEEQLRVSQKMEALGSLAGGIAHDFNNLLSVILTCTTFAIDELPEETPVRNDLFQIRRAATSAATLVRQLLAFSRKQVLAPVALNLNHIVSGIERMLRRVVGENIEVVRNLAPDLGLTLADPGQVEQVLMNLTVNARDAMPEGGRLSIATANIEVDERFAAQHGGMQAGSYVLLTVADSGCGMDESIKARIFDPFFTTKGPGKGTGLGLSTVFGIVKQSGGSVWVESEPGKGATFGIYLPRNLSASVAKTTSPSLPAVSATGAETVLVVDDEDELRRLATRALEALGFKVLAAANGEEALEIAERHEGEIHLLLTDVVMPRMNGKTLARELLKRRAGLKVVYVSGYTDDAVLRPGDPEERGHWLAKPYAPSDLARKVWEVLDRGNAGLAPSS